MTCERFPYTLSVMRRQVTWGTRCPSKKQDIEFEPRRREMFEASLRAYDERVKDAVLLAHAPKALDEIGIGEWLTKPAKIRSKKHPADSRSFVDHHQLCRRARPRQSAPREWTADARSLFVGPYRACRTLGAIRGRWAGAGGRMTLQQHNDTSRGDNYLENDQKLLACTQMSWRAENVRTVRPPIKALRSATDEDESAES